MCCVVRCLDLWQTGPCPISGGTAPANTAEEVDVFGLKGAAQYNGCEGKASAVG